MPAVFILLASLIGIAPELTIVGRTLSDGLILGIVAVAAGIAGVSLNEGDLRRFAQVVGPIVPIVLIPALWMLLQISPIPGRWLPQSIWITAAAALDRPVGGLISIDVGATLLCLARYTCFVGVLLVATAVTLDRQRAARVVFLLTAATAVIAAELIVADLGYVHIARLALAANRAEMLNIAVLGLILSTALAIHVLERDHTTRARNRALDVVLRPAMAISVAAFAFCLAAILLNPRPILISAALFGVGTLLAMVAIRRLGLGRLGQSGVAAIAAFGLVVFIVSNPAFSEADPTLALANPSQASFAAAARMLSDTAWTGSGAGTFEALLPIYRAAGDATSAVAAAPTAAASIAIELGPPMLWGLLIAALIGALLLFAGALRRGRDSVYAGAGAGCIVALLILSFGNAGIFGRAASILAGATCGLALAQSRSWPRT